MLSVVSVTGCGFTLSIATGETDEGGIEEVIAIVLVVKQKRPIKDR